MKYLQKISDIDVEILSDESSRPSSLRVYPNDQKEDEHGIAVYYAPFDNVNPLARVVFIGITPGEA